ncbi:MAG: hypothetical protein ABSE46_05825 [Terracidiphilus sp.]|jgi:hypothetical protein
MNWKGWLLRGILVLLVGFVVIYFGDYALFRLRGSPLSKVTINQFQSVPLKGTKIEYDYLGTSDVPCSQSLFPHAGQSPCWYLRRNPNQNTSL